MGGCLKLTVEKMQLHLPRGLAWEVFVGFRSPSQFLKGLLWLGFGDFCWRGSSLFDGSNARIKLNVAIEPGKLHIIRL